MKSLRLAASIAAATLASLIALPAAANAAPPVFKTPELTATNTSAGTVVTMTARAGEVCLGPGLAKGDLVNQDLDWEYANWETLIRGVYANDVTLPPDSGESPIPLVPSPHSTTFTGLAPGPYFAVMSCADPFSDESTDYIRIFNAGPPASNPGLFSSLELFNNFVLP